MPAKQKHDPKKHGPAILEWLADGKPLIRYCRESGVSKSTVQNWKNADEKFRGAFEAARVEGAYAMAEEALEIADDTSNDTVTDDKGNERPNTEWIARSKLRCEIRLKLAACYAPHVFGQNAKIEHKGELTLAQIVGGANKLEEKGE